MRKSLLMKATVLPISMVVAVAILGCNNSQLENPPEHLLGIWYTGEQSYAEDSLEIRHDRILFGTANGERQAYMISAVREGVEKGRVLYTIQYHGPDLGEQELTFFYNVAAGGFITFKHQPQLRWTKKRRSA